MALIYRPLRELAQQIICYPSRTAELLFDTRRRLVRQSAGELTDPEKWEETYRG